MLESQGGNPIGKALVFNNNNSFLFRAITFEKLVGGDVWCLFKNMPWDGLRIVPKSLWGGLMGCFLHCVNGKKSLWGTPENSEKSQWVV